MLSSQGQNVFLSVLLWDVEGATNLLLIGMFIITLTYLGEFLNTIIATHQIFLQQKDLFFFSRHHEFYMIETVSDYRGITPTLNLLINSPSSFGHYLLSGDFSPILFSVLSSLIEEADTLNFSRSDVFTPLSNQRR